MTDLLACLLTASQWLKHDRRGAVRFERHAGCVPNPHDLHAGSSVTRADVLGLQPAGGVPGPRHAASNSHAEPTSHSSRHPSNSCAGGVLATSTVSAVSFLGDTSTRQTEQLLALPLAPSMYPQ